MTDEEVKKEPKDCIINAPLIKSSCGMFSPTGIAQKADKDGEIKQISVGNGELAGSTKIDGDIGEEYYEVTSLKPEDRGKNERHIVHHLLPLFNKDNNSNYIISAEIPEQYDSADVYIEDSETGRKIGVQVTFSDPDAKDELRRTKSLSRKKNIDDLITDAINTSILKKKEKHYSDSKELILALEWWWGFTADMLNRYKSKNARFLSEAGFKQIWYVGFIEGTIIRLY